MDKKRKTVGIIVAIAVVLIALAYYSVDVFLPRTIYNKRLKRFASYEVKECYKDKKRVTKRLEMSEKEYLALKESLIDKEGWSDGTEYINESGEFLSPEFFSQSEREGERERIIRVYTPWHLPKIRTPYSIYVRLRVVKQGDRVFIQYDAFFTNADWKLD
jgi:hypothetical protein